MLLKIVNDSNGINSLIDRNNTEINDFYVNGFHFNIICISVNLI